jgi:hypothetical protein
MTRESAWNDLLANPCQKENFSSQAEAILFSQTPMSAMDEM